jgi:hypothetical protein
MSSYLLAHPYAKAATNGAVLLTFLVAVPHTPLPVPLHHTQVREPPASVSVLHPNASYFTIPGTITLHAGESKVDTTGRLSIYVNAIQSKAANVTLEYHNCVANHCVANGHPVYKTTIGVGSSVRYSGRSIALTALTSDSATFSIRN